MALLLAASGTVAASQPVFAVTTNQLSINDFNGKLYNVLLNQCDTNGDGTLTTSELASYTYVDLSNQSLTDLTGIEYLSGATYIDLSGNKLTSLAGLKYNYKLTYLDISDNNFTTLDSILDNSDAYVNLQELDASGNKLTDMSGAVVCSNLTTLDLSNNQLSSLSSSMVLMKKLKSLDLSNNKISSIPGLPSSLTSLSLSSNKMTDLSFASKLTALEYLDASDNLIGYVLSVTDGAGYGGDITVALGIDLKGTVTGFSPLQHSETPGYGAKCEEEGYINQFPGITSADQIDGIAGATFTTNAIHDAVAGALQFVSSNFLS